MSGRTKNAVRNIWAGVFNKVVVILFPFFIRNVLINFLGIEYLGLDSLFTSILRVLNVMELGFGSAVLFLLYKPIATNNTEEICALMNLYKKVYRIIGSIVLVAGISIVPFLDNFINGEYPNNINIYFLYAIYLFNTVVSYFLFAYKSVLLNAQQRMDITDTVSSLVRCIIYIVQILVIIIFKNYYIYIIFLPCMTILNNIICALIAIKKYPDYFCKGDIRKLDISGIKKKVIGVLAEKICGLSRNSIGNVFVSKNLGLAATAIFGNYYYIMQAVINVMSIFTNAIMAGIGESVAKESIEKNYKDFRFLNFAYMWFSGCCVCCLLCGYQNFMSLWVGDNYLLPFSSVILFSIYLYVLSVGNIRGVYNNACGLTWQTRYRSLVEAVFNIILSWIFVKFWGINGILISTIFSIIVINFAYGAHIEFKYYLGIKKLKEYLFDTIKYTIITIVVCTITYNTISLLNYKMDFMSLVIRFLMCFVISNVCYMLIYSMTGYAFYYKRIFKLIKRI